MKFFIPVYKYKKNDASIFEALYSHFSHKSPFLTQYFNLTSKNNGKTQLV